MKKSMKRTGAPKDATSGTGKAPKSPKKAELPPKLQQTVEEHRKLSRTSLKGLTADDFFPD